MNNKIKNIFIDLFFSLVIIILLTVFSDIFAFKITNNNKLFVSYINMIKSENNIINTNKILFTKDSLKLIKKYIISVIDSFVKFDKVPSIDDIKNFFKLIIDSLNDEIKIEKINIYENKIKLDCQTTELKNINIFIKDIKNMEYIDYISYNKYINDHNQYNFVVICFHND